MTVFKDMKLHQLPFFSLVKRNLGELQEYHQLFRRKCKSKQPASGFAQLLSLYRVPHHCSVHIKIVTGEKEHKRNKS